MQHFAVTCCLVERIGHGRFYLRSKNNSRPIVSELRQIFQGKVDICQCSEARKSLNCGEFHGDMDTWCI